MLYVGILEDHNKVRRMYISSEPYSDEGNNVTYLDFNRQASKKGDVISQEIEVGILRNVLLAGGAEVRLEV